MCKTLTLRASTALNDSYSNKSGAPYKTDKYIVIILMSRLLQFVRALNLRAHLAISLLVNVTKRRGLLSVLKVYEHVYAIRYRLRTIRGTIVTNTFENALVQVQISSCIEGYVFVCHISPYLFLILLHDAF